LLAKFNAIFLFQFQHPNAFISVEKYFIPQAHYIIFYNIFLLYIPLLASCDDPGHLARGRRNGNQFSHGQMVEYECTTQGYSLVGKPQLNCNDGIWDSKRPECKGRYHITLNYRLKYRAIYEFKLSPVFSPFTATCDPLPALSNGKVNSHNTNHGAVVSFSCNKGFQLKGSKEITCIDGKWNANSPTCKGLSHSLMYILFRAPPFITKTP